MELEIDPRGADLQCEPKMPECTEVHMPECDGTLHLISLEASSNTLDVHIVQYMPLVHAMPTKHV